MFKWPGGPRKTFPEVRGLKYQFVYLKIRIFRCSHRMTYETPRSKTHKSHDVCIYIYILYVFTGMHISMNYNDLILTSLEGWIVRESATQIELFSSNFQDGDQQLF